MANVARATPAWRASGTPITVCAEAMAEAARESAIIDCAGGLGGYTASSATRPNTSTAASLLVY